MNDSAPTLRLDRDGRVAHLTLDRPPLNILDLATLQALESTVRELAGEADLQLVVIRGAGERAFSAGVAVEDHVADRIEPTLTTFHRALLALRELAPITVAAVRGHCLGGGLELASACDLVLASERSRFGTPEIKLGCYPPVAAALYPRQLGWDRALDLMLTGRVLAAPEAERWGLVTRVVADDDFEAELTGLCAAITGHSLPVTRLLKRASRSGEHRPFPEALAEAERLYLTDLMATRDMHEGIQAFLDKRAPSWAHR